MEIERKKRELESRQKNVESQIAALRATLESELEEFQQQLTAEEQQKIMEREDRERIVRSRSSDGSVLPAQDPLKRPEEEQP